MSISSQRETTNKTASDQNKSKLNAFIEIMHGSKSHA